MDKIINLQNLIIQFRDERDWKQFHNPKDCALSLLLEATELLEYFQWKNGEDIEKTVIENKKEISYELVDVLYWVLLIAYDQDIDLEKVLKEKLILNAEKYPIEKAKGRSNKYSKE